MSSGPKNQIVFAYDEGGDWVAVYINGECFDQNHSLSLETVLKALDQRYTSIQVPEAVGYDSGYYPEKLTDLQSLIAGERG